ncbi:hypothetical protein Acy02nite_85680 [Actinoplanes cyaneus]|uniref:Uncharacterized protein n=1 Tax=Actinoplanes cyaneus TaxID=52696 RepID=A0A919M9B3_9ACTN|nr:hypothetical protein [Actinoplanes cyaneus]MCW2143907.1 hypothetical protein [Actinoplanes cyaneus]GID70687.1 hypothetical protein Acy02nite_85680 [Actinoplanes cyaneus]
MPIRRVLIILVLLLGGTSGCGGTKDDTTSDGSSQTSSSTGGPDTGTGDASGGPGGEPQQENGTGGDPKSEGQGPEKPAPETDRPWAKLANAPVGADQTYTEKVDEEFCVGINMLTSPREGVSVKIVEVWTTPDGRIDVNGGTCEGRPACDGYTFSPENGTCSVSVTPRRSDPTGDVGTRLKFRGEVYCAAGAEASCKSWYDDAGGNSDDQFVTLYLPAEPGPKESRSPSLSPSPSPSTDASADD